MIRLVFTVSREPFRIEIKGREIYYSDRKWKRDVRLIPKDIEFNKKVLMSRNKIPSHISQMFELTDEEKKEYEGAKTEEELAVICIHDAKKRGALLAKQEEIKDGNI